MSAAMTAALAYRDEQHLKIESVPIPDVGDGDVLIRIERAGMNTGLLFNWRVLKRMPLMPQIIGIHGAGIVEEIGANVFGVTVGDRVRVDPILSCGRCEMCCADQHLLCPTHCVMGFDSTPGGMERFQRYGHGNLAEFWRVPESAVEVVPDNVSFDVAARLGTLGVSYAALRMAGSHEGSSIVLTGASGASGATTIRCAPRFGIEKVIAVARSQANLDDVAKLVPGLVETVALESLDPNWEETGALTDAIGELAGSPGPQGLIDFMPGSPAALRQALYAVRPGGNAVLAAAHRERIELDYVPAMPNGQYHLMGLRGYARRDMLQLRRHLASGRLEVDDLVTQTFPLERINDAIDHLDSRGGGTRTWWVNVDPR